jgi:hypothetical protein
MNLNTDDLSAREVHYCRAAHTKIVRYARVAMPARLGRFPASQSQDTEKITEDVTAVTSPISIAALS